MRNHPISGPKLLLVAVTLWLAATWPGNAWATEAGNDLAVRVDQGLAALAEGRFEEARAGFSAGLDAARQAADASWTGRFHFYLGLSDQLEAEEAGAGADAPLLASAAERYRQALTVTPRDGDSLNNLAQVRWRQGRTEDAAVAFEQALQAAAGERLAFYAGNYGRLLREQGDWKGAARVYWQGVGAAPGDTALIQDLQELLAERDPAGLPRLPAWLIDHGQVAQAERCAAWALAQRSGPPAVQVELLALLATALARQIDSPSGFLTEPTARTLEEAADLPVIGPGARELLLLQGGDRGEPTDYSWWARQDEPLGPERSPADAFRELIHSLGDRHAAAQDDLKAEAYYRLAEGLVPGKPDLQAALARAELYAAGRRDADLEVLLADLSGRVEDRGEPGSRAALEEAVQIRTSVGVLYHLLWQRTSRPPLLRLAADQLEQAFRLADEHNHPDATGTGSQATSEVPIPVAPGFLERVAQVQEAAGRGADALKARLALGELYAERGETAAALEVFRGLETDARWGVMARQDPDAWDRLGGLATRLEVPRPSFPQHQGGPVQVAGVVVADDGSPLPGVTLILTGAGPPQVQVTGADGAFRFPGVPPGQYEVTATLDGFSTVESEVVVGVAMTNVVRMTMNSGVVEEEITVTSETPIPGELLTGELLAGRDFRAVTMMIEPGPSADSLTSFQVLLDNVVLDNAAGLLDGLSLRGLEGVLIQRGGPDAAVEGPGPTLQAITRSSESLRGSAWASFSDPAWQSSSPPDRSDLAGCDSFADGCTPQRRPSEGDRLKDAKERGVELGGTVLDNLGLWGLLSRERDNLLAFGGGRQGERSNTLVLRPTAEFGTTNSMRGLLYGREAKVEGDGAAPDRSPETTWDEERRTTVVKIEDSHVLSPRFFLQGLAGWDEARTERVPQGGAAEGAVWDRDLVWRRSSLSSISDRTWLQGKVDALSLFRSHEMKAGLSFRTFEEEGRSFWPGEGSVVSYPAFGTAQAYAPAATRARTEHGGLYAQGTLSFEHLTANVGVRSDLQTGHNLGSAVAANPLFPELLPQAEFGGGGRGPRWEALSPRLSLKYQAGESRRTELDAWYARYSDRLDASTVLLGNPLVHRSVYFRWNDRDGDGTFDPSEPVADPVFRGVDPQRPGATVLGGFAPGFGPGITDELAFGIRRSFAGSWAAGAQLTWRNRHDIPELERLVYDSPRGPESGIGRPHRRGDYELFRTVTGTLPDGQPYSVPVYRLRPGITWLGGFLATNGEREQELTGVTLELEKRSGTWKLQSRFEWKDHTWRVPDEEREDPTNVLGSGDDDGAAVLTEVPGLGAQPSDYLGGRWSFDLASTFAVAPERRWGLDALIRIRGREGEPVPYFRRVGPEETGDGVVRFVQVTPRSDSYRSEDLFLLDAVLRKTFERGDWTSHLDLSASNLLDARTVLRREPMLGFSRSDHVEQTARARSLSLGLTINFR